VTAKSLRVRIYQARQVSDMKASRRFPTGVRIIIGFFVVSVLIWVVGQGGAVVTYDRVAELGFHPERDQVDPITVLVTQGIAVGDVLIQLPFFLVAILGLWRLRFFGVAAAWIALGINLYWTSVAWAKQFYYLQAGVDTEPFGFPVHAPLAFIFLFSAWASWYLYVNRTSFD
jgi:hypothetical protein